MGSVSIWVMRLDGDVERFEVWLGDEVIFDRLMSLSWLPLV